MSDYEKLTREELLQMMSEQTRAAERADRAACTYIIKGAKHAIHAVGVTRPETESWADAIIRYARLGGGNGTGACVWGG